MNDLRVKHRSTWAAYIDIARLDHWFKQVFCLPGVLLAVFLAGRSFNAQTLWSVFVAFWATSLVASSNYVINEILDAPQDRSHPDKRHRPIPSGLVRIPIAYIEWFVLGAAGLWLAWTINVPFFACAFWLWIMGLIYNVPPIRAKELAVFDVLCESINNPIRLLLGWYAMGVEYVAPISLISAYWMVGAYFMAAKRFAEYRHINDKAAAGAYRKSFRWYNESRLIALQVFYVSIFSMMLGVFLEKYRVELLLMVPFVAAVIMIYWHLSLQDDSPVQNPEKLYKNKRLMVACVLMAIVGIAALKIDLPWMIDLFRIRPATPLH